MVVSMPHNTDGHLCMVVSLNFTAQHSTMLMASMQHTQHVHVTSSFVCQMQAAKHNTAAQSQPNRA